MGVQETEHSGSFPGVYGGIGTMIRSELRPTPEKVQAFMNRTRIAWERELVVGGQSFGDSRAATLFR